MPADPDIVRLTQTHTVSVLLQSVSAGSDMDNLRTYAATGTTLACRIAPASAREIVRFQQRGMVVTDKLYFAENPHLTEKNRLQRADTNAILVLVGVPQDAAGEGRLWVLFAEERTHENGTTAIG